MSPQCSGGFLFHQWGSTGKCLRCGINAAFDPDPSSFDFDRSHHRVHLDQGKVADERSVDDRSASALLSPTHLADHPSLFGSLLPAFLRRHHQ